MRQHSNLAKDTAEKVVKDIRRATRKQYSAEEKIRIVLEGLRGEDSIAELCRREGIAQNLYYRWSKDFLEAGKKRLAGDTARAATSDEVKDLRREASETRKSTLKSMLRGNCGCGPGVEGVATRALRAWSRVPSVISQFPSYFAVKIVSASVGYARSGSSRGIVVCSSVHSHGRFRWRHSSQHWQGVRPCVQRTKRRRAAGCGSRSHDQNNHRGRPKRRT